MVLEKIHSEIERQVDFSKTESGGLDFERIATEFFSVIPFDEASAKQMRERVATLSGEEKVKEFLAGLVDQLYEAREKQYGPAITRQIEKLVLLNTIDSLWINHLEDIDYLREGIGLRGYAARDPLIEYKGEAFKIFDDLMRAIDYEVVHRIFKIQVAPPEQHPAQPHQHQPIHGSQTSTSGSPVVTSQSESSSPAAQQPRNLETSKKIGRNDPCPCGSGLKYKKCGLIGAPQHKS